MTLTVKAMLSTTAIWATQSLMENSARIMNGENAWDNHFPNNLITINQVNALKAWEKLYESEDLDEAIELAEKVIIKSNDGVQIIA